MTPERFGGTRDRSWGVRPRSRGRPVRPGDEDAGIFWLWSPLQLDDGCLHTPISEDARGADPRDRGRRVDHDLTWDPGYRRAKRAAFTVEHLDERGTERLELTPVGRIHMLRRPAGLVGRRGRRDTWGDRAGTR